MPKYDYLKVLTIQNKMVLSILLHFPKVSDKLCFINVTLLGRRFDIKLQTEATLATWNVRPLQMQEKIYKYSVFNLIAINLCNKKIYVI